MSDESEIERRRQRLQALRAKRETLSASAGTSKIGTKEQGNRGPLGSGGPKPGGPARQMLARLMLKTLQGGVAGQSRTIPGKDYTEQGVARFAALLRKRSEDPATPGAEVAKRLLQTVTQPSNDPQGMVAGVNLAQLDKLVVFARKSLNGEAGPATAASPMASQREEPRGDSIAEMRASMQQLASTVETLTRKLQQLTQGASESPPAVSSGAAPGQQAGGVGRPEPARQPAPASGGSDWVDDFVEDR
jgi:hypothetical protein